MSTADEVADNALRIAEAAWRECQRKRDGRLAAAVTVACVAVGAAVALGCLAAWLAAHEGKMPGMPAVIRVPDFVPDGL
jgi:hypothetical protein